MSCLLDCIWINVDGPDSSLLKVVNVLVAKKSQREAMIRVPDGLASN